MFNGIYYIPNNFLELMAQRSLEPPGLPSRAPEQQQPLRSAEMDRGLAVWKGRQLCCLERGHGLPQQQGPGLLLGTCTDLRRGHIRWDTVCSSTLPLPPLPPPVPARLGAAECPH